METHDDLDPREWLSHVRGDEERRFPLDGLVRASLWWERETSLEARLDVVTSEGEEVSIAIEPGDLLCVGERSWPVSSLLKFTVEIEGPR